MKGRTLLKDLSIHTYIQSYISIHFMGRAVKMTSRMRKPKSSSNGNRMCNKAQHSQNSHTSRIYTPDYNMKTKLETMQRETMACLSLLVPIVDSRAHDIEASCSIMDREFLDYINY